MKHLQYNQEVDRGSENFEKLFQNDIETIFLHTIK